MDRRLGNGRGQQLWDLPDWADTTCRLHAALDTTSGLRNGFMLIAQVVRHLRLDPHLPPALLPPGGPGQPLREQYTAFRDHFAQRLRNYSTG